MSHPFLGFSALPPDRDGGSAPAPPPAKRARTSKHTGLELHQVHTGDFARPPPPLRIRWNATACVDFRHGAQLALQPLCRALRLQPRVSQLAVSAPEPYSVCTMDTDKETGECTLSVPRFFAETVWAKMYTPEEIVPSPRVRLAPHLDFAGTLQPRQEDACAAALAAYARGGRGGAMLELPCGFGKTVISLAILARLKVRTLVLASRSCAP